MTLNELIVKLGIILYKSDVYIEDYYEDDGVRDALRDDIYDSVKRIKNFNLRDITIMDSV